MHPHLRFPCTKIGVSIIHKNPCTSTHGRILDRFNVDRLLKCTYLFKRYIQYFSLKNEFIAGVGCLWSPLLKLAAHPPPSVGLLKPWKECRGTQFPPHLPSAECSLPPRTFQLNHSPGHWVPPCLPTFWPALVVCFSRVVLQPTRRIGQFTCSFAAPSLIENMHVVLMKHIRTCPLQEKSVL